MAGYGRRRGSTLALLALGLGGAALLLVLQDAGRLARTSTAARVSPVPARVLQLTDPALFNEARYARHASQADHAAAFQDHPMALEHFPAGSMIPPPDAHLD